MTIKSTAANAGWAVLETTLDGVEKAWNKTGGAVKRSVAHKFWAAQGQEFSTTIAACNDCKNDYVGTGSYWKNQQDQYCDAHRDRARKIITKYNASIKS